MATALELELYLKRFYPKVNVHILPLDVFMLNYNKNIHSFNIVNTSSYHEKGRHWILIEIKPEGKNVFFDSFGHYADHYSRPLDILIQPYICSTTQLQNPQTTLCWAFCLDVFQQLLNGLTLAHIVGRLHRIDSTKKNDYIARKYLPVINWLRSKIRAIRHH